MCCFILKVSIFDMIDLMRSVKYLSDKDETVNKKLEMIFWVKVWHFYGSYVGWNCIRKSSSVCSPYE